MSRVIKSKERKQLQTCRDHEALQTRFARQEKLLHTLQQDNKALLLRIRQYEHCLDDVMRKVVDAIVAEDNLREEVTLLKGRVREQDAQNLLGTSTSSTNVMTIEAKEPLYETVQQLVKEVRELALRQNPCEQYTHGGNEKRNFFKSSNYCSFCRISGHDINECYKRKNNVYCNRCKRQGHSDYNCRMNRQDFRRPSNEDRNQVRVDDNRQRTCYKCKQQGHISTNCPRNINSRDYYDRNDNDRRSNNQDSNNNNRNTSGNGFRPSQN